MPAQGCDVTRCGEAGPRKTRLLCLVDIVMELMRAVMMFLSIRDQEDRCSHAKSEALMCRYLGKSNLGIEPTNVVSLGIRAK